MAIEERLNWEKHDVKLAPCLLCKHKHIDGPTCDAFPTGIPDEILDGSFDHKTPFPGDHGIQFERIEEA